jgi:NAD+--asparagine ADP-ribosyltransferase
MAVQQPTGKVVSGYANAKRIANDFKGANNAVGSNENVFGITFLSCFGANAGPFSSAQMLANATGLRVQAYQGRIHQVHAANDSTLVKVFAPQGKAAAAFSGIGNKLGASVIIAFLEVRNKLLGGRHRS